MKTSVGIVMFCLLLLLPLPFFGEAYLSLGGAGSVEPEATDVFSPDVRLAAGGNLFAPLSDEWSMFLSGSFLHCWRPLDAHFRYLYAVAWDASLRSDDWLLKAGLKASGERVYAEGLGLPDRFDNAFELRAARDLGDTTLFIAPQLAFVREDVRGDDLRLRGEAGITFLLSARLVATLKGKGSATLVPLPHRTYTAGGEAVLSWYPDAPVGLTFTLGGYVQDSDYTEVMAGTEIDRYDFTQAYAVAELSFPVADALLLRILLPARFSFKAMNAVRDGTFRGEKEWTLALAPEIEASFTLGERHRIAVQIKAEPFFSNSDYHDAGYGECSVLYRVSF